MVGKALNLEGAEIRRHVYGCPVGERRMQINGMIDLRAKVTGQVAFSNAIVDAPGQKAVDFEAAEIGGSVLFSDKTLIKGRIDLRAKVKGQVEFLNTIVDAPDQTAVNFDAAEIGGIVLFRDKTLIHGHISAIQSRLNGGIWATNNMSRTAFAYPGTAGTANKHLLVTGGMNLCYAELGGPLLLDCATISESLNARHLVVNGDLHLCGSVMGLFSPESRRLMDEAIKHLTGALQDRAEIERKIRQTEQPDEELEKQLAAADEKVDACHVALWGGGRGWNDWELEDLRAENVPDDPKELFAIRQQNAAINLELSVIRGQFWVKSSRILGTIHAEDAEIDGEANFSNSKVEGNLVLRSIKVQGKVFADETDATGPYPQVRGKVDLQDAKLLQINVNFTHSNDPDAILPQELDLSGAQTAELCLLGELAPRKSAGAANTGGPVLRMDGIKFESICVTPRSNQPNTVAPLTIDLTGIETDPSINRRRVLLAWVGSVAFLCICFAVWYLGITGVWAHAIIENYPRNHLGFDQPRAYFALGIWTLIASAIAITIRKNLARTPSSPSGSPLSKPAESPASKCTWRDVVRISTWIGLVGLAGLLLVLLSPTAMTYGRWEIVIAAVVLIVYVTLTVYRWIHPKILPAETTAIVRLLRRVEPNRQLYIDVEQMFKRQGDDDSADEVFLTRRKAEPFPFTQEARKQKKWHFWSTVQDIAAGYGSRVSRPIHLYLLLFMINSLVFANPLAVEYQRGAGHNRRDVGPQATQLPTTMAVNPWESDGGKPNDGQWGILRGMFISLRIQIPFLPLIADADWAPTSRPMRTLPLSYENYAAVCVAINLALLPLMFAGLRRAMKKDAI